MQSAECRVQSEQPNLQSIENRQTSWHGHLARGKRSHGQDARATENRIQQTLFTIPCEAVFNQHPCVFRSALVGIGFGAGEQTPVIIVEPRKGVMPKSKEEVQRFTEELLALARANPKTRDIHKVLFHRAFPVDARHNAKINREKLAEWATRKMKR